MQVLVPHSDLPLAPVSPDRVLRLREHLEGIIAGLADKRLDAIATPVRNAPAGFSATVIQSACALCRGWCCRKGGDDAYLDDRTLARVRLERHHGTASALVDLYLDRVPERSCEASCIFHGEEGCTLDRSMRSDVCNRYYCGGLEVFLQSIDDPEPTVVVAGAGKTLLMSPTLVP